jgi:hypothetical protein
MAGGIHMRNSFVVAVGLLIFSTRAMADDLAYGLYGFGKEFGVLDLTTGAVTDVGATGGLVDGGFGLFPFFAGLGVDPQGGLYTIDYQLFKLDPTTGEAANDAIGGDFNNDPAGMGSTSNGSIYEITLDEPATGPWYFTLSSINPANGSTTFIGDTGIQFPTSGFYTVPQMSTGSSNLYFPFNSELYRLNTSTGAATLVGNMGAQIDSMVFENGTLYGVESGRVDQINGSTGALTPGPATADQFVGLAPASLPEPAILFLLVGAGFIGLSRRRSLK